MNQKPLFDLEPHTPLFSGQPVKAESQGPALPYSVPVYGLKLVREDTIRYGERPQVLMPTDCANFLQGYFSGCHVEQLVVVLLDTKNNVIGVNMVYQGSLNAISIRVADIFKPAIVGNANCIILSHNHPSSGDPTPSPEDVRVTEMLCDAGRLLDVEILDHLVFGQNRFVSLKERGLGF